MRLFEFSTFYRAYEDYFYGQRPEARGLSYAELKRVLLADRFDATHILEPVYATEEAGYTVASDRTLQERWATEKGLKSRDLTDILLAQIEEHRAEVVYSLNPIQFSSGFARRLPGSVKQKVCWLAVEIGRHDYSGYDLCLSNFPPFLEQWQAVGARAAYFSPSHDPVMGDYAANEDRPIDIAFAGTYSAKHAKRNEVLRVVTSLAKRHKVVLALVSPARRPLLDLRFLRRIPGPIPYLPPELRAVAAKPVFGRQLYELFSRSKVVLNAAIDMSREYRGNMRCFEALGCGACMLSDRGLYPDGMIDGETFVAYDGPQDALAKAEALLREPERGRAIGRAGALLMSTAYSKSRQWAWFQGLVVQSKPARS